MTTPEAWRRIRTVYEHVSSLPPAQRSEALIDACAGDDELRRTIVRMLDADGTGRLVGVVERAAATALRLGLDAGMVDEAPGIGADDRIEIDRYRLEGRIGEGGMGVVYTASRADGLLTGRFAIKVLRRGMESELFIRRFAEERSALERLDHPSIARLFDAGSCADGRPYLVMELVEGRPIDVWSREARPGVRELVTLFAQVCDAVSYAHGRLVVHRDLKPSNILVTEQGAPKLLDFGIARILDQADGAPAVTRFDERLLTPRYACPELLDGGPVTTATDVYSLGVVLYELLTGAEPYSVSEHTFAAYGRAVREQTPPPPSTAIRAAGTTTRERNAASRRLRGDLDTIVQKAMRKDPKRRYDGAAAMAADFRAHLGSRPIAARAESLGYTVHKLIRRHPWQVVSAGASIAGVVGLSVVSLVQAQRAAIAEGESNRAMREAQTHAAIADRFGEFLTQEFLLQLDPARSRDGALTLEEAVRRAADRIEGRFPDAPLAEALIEHTVGDAFIQRTLYAQAEPHLRRAWQLREAHLGSEALETLLAKRDLATALFSLARPAEARVLLDEVVAVQERTSSPDDGLLLLSRSILARTLAALGEDAAAERLFIDTYEARRRTLGSRDGNTMSSMNQLGVFYNERGRFAEAVPYFEEAAVLRRAEFGDDHPRTLIARANLATVRARMGDQASAIDELRAVRRDQLRVLGPTHGHTLHVLGLLGDLETTRGALDAAIELRRERVTALAAGPNTTPAALAEARLVLVELLLDRGRTAEAAQAMEALRTEIDEAAADTPALSESLRRRVDAAAERLHADTRSP